MTDKDCVLVASDSDLVADDVNGWEDVFLQEIGQLYPMIQEVTVTVSCSVTQVDFGCKNADEILLNTLGHCVASNRWEV